MAGSFILADSPRVRFATGSIMYFAKGIPQGLLAIATGTKKTPHREPDRSPNLNTQ